MVVKRRKKITKMRGTRTHGWGLVHRNSGQRGGAGNAGRGKKSHSNKPSNWLDKENPRYFGKHGFIHQGPLSDQVIINIYEVEDKLPQWIAEKKATLKDGKYDINLQTIGYTKLLSTGKATKKLMLTINSATEKAIQKITKAGGAVTIAKDAPKKDVVKQDVTKQASQLKEKK